MNVEIAFALAMLSLSLGFVRFGPTRLVDTINSIQSWLIVSKRRANHVEMKQPTKISEVEILLLNFFSFVFFSFPFSFLFLFFSFHIHNPIIHKSFTRTALLIEISKIIMF